MFKKKRNLVDWVFLLIGARFYLDWILPTNPQSKNVVIRFFWGNAKNPQRFGFGRNYHIRFVAAITYLGIHTPFCYAAYVTGSMWSLSNMLVNIYPIIVQLYIGYRIIVVMLHKKRIKKYAKQASHNNA